jgi:hypothetical protein
MASSPHENGFVPGSPDVLDDSNFLGSLGGSNRWRTSPSVNPLHARIDRPGRAINLARDLYGSLAGLQHFQELLSSPGVQRRSAGRGPSLSASTCSPWITKGDETSTKQIGRATEPWRACFCVKGWGMGALLATGTAPEFVAHRRRRTPAHSVPASGLLQRLADTPRRISLPRFDVDQQFSMALPPCQHGLSSSGRSAAIPDRFRHPRPG